MSQRHSSRWLAGFGLAFILTACSDGPTPSAPATLSAPAPSAEAVKFWEVGSSVAWNATARELLAVPGNPFAGPSPQARVLAYVSVAEYNAIASRSVGQ